MAISKLTPASQLVGPENDSASWTLKQRCSQPILSVQDFESFSFYEHHSVPWELLLHMCCATAWIKENTAETPLHSLQTSPSLAPAIHTYQFVWMFTRCCCFEWEHFKTQIIYQLNTIQRSFKAICSKFVIINVQGSCRKLYNCKAFQKNVLMLISGLFDPETKGNPGLVGYSLTNIDFGFS